MSVKKDIRFRVYLSFTGILLFALLILGKAAWVQVVQGPKLRSMARNMNLRNDTLFSERGNIYSEDGVLLCSTIPQFDLHIDFSVMRDNLLRQHSNVRCLR